ncbi:DUF4349 domain-containing protein [Microbacterium sp. YY-01]|uniref:DUF4349 domain-containing protein n=1 Tax=Microbacterium sp. YY-01 TaxID=3421634 RepID=UPI003D16607E
MTAASGTPHSGSTPTPAPIPGNAAPALPELHEERIRTMEDNIFARIDASDDAARRMTGSQHVATGRRPRRRMRGWAVGLGVAAAFVVGAVISPAIVMNSMSLSSSDSAGDYAVPPRSSSEESRAADGTADMGADMASDIAAERQIITTGTVTLRVDDIAASAETIAALAQEQGGYVEAQRIASRDSRATVPDADAEVVSGWITIRIPATSMTSTTGALGDIGTVTSSSIEREDVTMQSIDLQARVDSARASVERLTELMAQSGSVADLVEAESVLAQRQAELESYEQQLKALSDQVAMSTLTVELNRTSTPATADPIGFTNGLATGWNTVIATLNGLVVALGFALPWLIPIAIVWTLVWLVVRARRRKRQRAVGGAGGAGASGGANTSGEMTSSTATGASVGTTGSTTGHDTP